MRARAPRTRLRPRRARLANRGTSRRFDPSNRRLCLSAVSGCGERRRFFLGSLVSAWSRHSFNQERGSGPGPLRLPRGDDKRLVVSPDGRPHSASGRWIVCRTVLWVSLPRQPRPVASHSWVLAKFIASRGLPSSLAYDGVATRCEPAIEALRPDVPGSWPSPAVRDVDSPSVDRNIREAGPATPHSRAASPRSGLR